MPSLPFDPVKALDLSRTPPPAASRDIHHYDDLPHNFWAGSASQMGRKNVTAIISIDAFSCASVARFGINGREWRGFLAQCILLGLPLPIAVANTRLEAMYVLCPPLFKSGFTTVRDHSRASEYHDAAIAVRGSVA